MWWGGALLHGAASPGAWRSTSNLFAVIAVRVYTLESSNSLFYFSHHEGDHLSSCLHFPPPCGVRSLPVCTTTEAHTNTQTQTQCTKIFVWDFDTSDQCPASVTWLQQRTCVWVYEVLVRMTVVLSHKRYKLMKVTQFPICGRFLFIQVSTHTSKQAVAHTHTNWASLLKTKWPSFPLRFRLCYNTCYISRVLSSGRSDSSCCLQLPQPRVFSWGGHVLF